MKFFSLFSRMGFSNTYLVGPDDGGDAVLVDPGVFDAPLLQAVEERDVAALNDLAQPREGATKKPT